MGDSQEPLILQISKIYVANLFPCHRVHESVKTDTSLVLAALVVIQRVAFLCYLFFASQIYFLKILVLAQQQDFCHSSYSAFHTQVLVLLQNEDFYY